MYYHQNCLITSRVRCTSLASFCNTNSKVAVRVMVMAFRCNNTKQRNMLQKSDYADFSTYLPIFIDLTFSSCPNETQNTLCRTSSQ